MGVASLLFHRTLSPKDTLHVHSYTLEKQQQHHTQLQVHSYAREHQPRHLQHKTYTQSVTQVQSLSQEPSCERTESQPENKIVLTEVAQIKQDQKEDKPEMLVPVEAQFESKNDEVEPTSNSASAVTQTEPIESDITEMEGTKNNRRKVCLLLLCFFVCLFVCFCNRNAFTAQSYQRCTR